MRTVAPLRRQVSSLEGERVTLDECWLKRSKETSRTESCSPATVAFVRLDRVFTA